MGSIHASKQFISLAIERDIVEKLNAQASELGITRSAAVRQAILAFVSTPALS